jgi:hypothetical protein
MGKKNRKVVERRKRIESFAKKKNNIDLYGLYTVPLLNVMIPNIKLNWGDNWLHFSRKEKKKVFFDPFFLVIDITFINKGN